MSALLVASAALAGCVGALDEPVNAASEAPGEAVGNATAPVERFTDSFEAAIDAGVAVHDGQRFLYPVATSQQFLFPVDANATAIVAEVFWDDPAQDLDLLVSTPDAGMDLLSGPPPEYTGERFDDTDGAVGMGDSPARVEVTGADALGNTGEWQLTVGTKAGAQIPFTAHVTVFYGDVPEGFTHADA